MLVAELMNHAIDIILGESYIEGAGIVTSAYEELIHVAFP